MALERRSGAGWAIHPGEILKKEFLEPLHLSGYRLARELGVNTQSINDIVLQKRGISADMAVRLGRFFQTSPEFWFNLQSAFDLTRASSTLKRKLSKIHPFKKAA